jgi:hypothetical protein
MAGDLRVTERVVPESDSDLRAAELGVGTQERAIHRYGRLAILAGPEQVYREEAATQELEVRDALGDLTEVERLGLAGLSLRQSDDYRQAKDARPRDGEVWDMEGCTSVVPPACSGAGDRRSGGRTDKLIP